MDPKMKRKYEKRSLETSRRQTFSLTLKVCAQEFYQTVQGSNEFDSIYVQDEDAKRVCVKTLKPHKKGFFQKWQDQIEEIETIKNNRFTNISGKFLLQSQQEKFKTTQSLLEENEQLKAKILEMNKEMEVLKCTGKQNQETIQDSKGTITKLNKYLKTIQSCLSKEQKKKIKIITELKELDFRKLEGETDEYFCEFAKKMQDLVSNPDIFALIKDKQNSYKLGNFMLIANSLLDPKEKQQIINEHIESYPELAKIRPYIIALCPTM